MTLLVLTILLAQSPAPTEPNWKQVCAAATAMPYVAPSGIAREAQPQSCDSEQAYYGFGNSPDPAAALRCALDQREQPGTSGPGVFTGAGILTMLYANGMGVARDYKTAIRFACEIEAAAPAEMEFRIGHLDKLLKTGPGAANLDICGRGQRTDEALLRIGSAFATRSGFVTTLQDRRSSTEIDPERRFFPAHIRGRFPVSGAR